jgi:hypothetical protein
VLHNSNAKLKIFSGIAVIKNEAVKSKNTYPCPAYWTGRLPDRQAQKIKIKIQKYTWLY